jgi:hypothetical protein
LVHYTTQEYIERIRETQFPEAQAVIAETCLTCLGFDMFTQSDDNGMHKLSDNYIFYRYAFRFWAEHVNDMGKQPEVQELALRFLIDERKSDSIERASGYLDGGILLHKIARYGLVTLFLIVLSGAPDSPSRYLSRYITVI